MLEAVVCFLSIIVVIFPFCLYFSIVFQFCINKEKGKKPIFYSKKFDWFISYDLRTALDLIGYTGFHANSILLAIFGLIHYSCAILSLVLILVFGNTFTFYLGLSVSLCSFIYLIVFLGLYYRIYQFKLKNNYSTAKTIIYNRNVFFNGPDSIMITIGFACFFLFSSMLVFLAIHCAVVGRIKLLIILIVCVVAFLSILIFFGICLFGGCYSYYRISNDGNMSYKKPFKKRNIFNIYDVVDIKHSTIFLPTIMTEKNKTMSVLAFVFITNKGCRVTVPCTIQINMIVKEICDKNNISYKDAIKF